MPTHWKWQCPATGLAHVKASKPAAALLLNNLRVQVELF